MDKSFIRAVRCVLSAHSEREEWIGRHSSFTVCYESSIPHISSRIPFGLPLDAATNLPSRPARAACPCKAIQFQFVCSDVFDSPLKQAAATLAHFSFGSCSPIFFRKSWSIVIALYLSPSWKYIPFFFFFRWLFFMVFEDSSSDWLFYIDSRRWRLIFLSKLTDGGCSVGHAGEI